MADTKNGVLVTCDVPTREFILHLNETHQFIIAELDETHLFIDRNFVKKVQDELKMHFEEQVFTIPSDKK